MRDVGAALLSVDAAAVKLRLSRVQNVVLEGGDELPPEAKKVITNFAPADAARIVQLTASARLSDTLLCVDLGERVRRQHLRVLLMRMLRDENGDEHEAERALPLVLRSLVVCSECGRVANAHVDCCPSESGGPCNFNGTQTMPTFSSHID